MAQVMATDFVQTNGQHHKDQNKPDITRHHYTILYYTL